MSVARRIDAQHRPPPLTGRSRSLGPPPSPESTVTITAPAVPDLLNLVRAVGDDVGLWRPVVRFGLAERYWRRLDVHPDVDVWLLTWLRAQSTDLHDHGESSAAFVVLEGALTEVRADRETGLSATTLTAPRARLVEAGVVHDVRNDEDTPAVSIHAYYPRLAGMTFYDFVDGRLVSNRHVPTDEPEASR
jgi:mannose-6-phosphate isomerase-like protein (cupin superfamily)